MLRVAIAAFAALAMTTTASAAEIDLDAADYELSADLKPIEVKVGEKILLRSGRPIPGGIGWGEAFAFGAVKSKPQKTEDGFVFTTGTGAGNGFIVVVGGQALPPQYDSKTYRMYPIVVVE